MRWLELLLPPACAGCGRFGSLLCAACVADLRPVRNAPAFLSPDPGVVLGDHLEAAVAAFAHHGSLRRALQRLKYGGAAALAAPLAAAALPAFGEVSALAGPGACLVPVPVHAARRRERGYNQAGLLAGALSELTGVGVRELLIRDRPTTRQHGLDRSARLRNLQAAFAPAPLSGATALPETAILVDDIITTAATLEACAEVLRRAGVGRALGFAIAREV